MSPLLTVLVLGYSGVHICFTDCSNVIIYIKISINQTFSFRTTLSILNINPYKCYVIFR